MVRKEQEKLENILTLSYFHSFDGRFGDGDHLCPRYWGLGVHQWEQLGKKMRVKYITVELNVWNHDRGCY